MSAPVESSATPRRRLLHPRRPNLLAFVAYLALGVQRYLPALWRANDRLALPGGDADVYVWSFGWMAHVVSEGANPLHTSFLNYPAGANILSNTTVPFLGLVMAPVTLLWGPVASYNIALTLGFATSGFAAYLLILRWTSWRPGAFVAGLVFSWSGYMLSAGLLYPNLSFVAPIPLIFLCLDQLLVRQDQPPIRWAIALGLLIVVEFFVSSELLADTAEITLVALIVLAVLHSREVVTRVRAALPGLAVAAGIAFVLLAYPAWYATMGPLHVQQLRPGVLYGVDAIGPVIPTSAQLLAPSALRDLGDKLSGGTINEFGHRYSVTGLAYLGIGATLAVLAVIVLGRRQPLVRFLGTMIGIAFLGSLGPSLKIANQDTGVPLPARALSRLPVLRSTAAERYALFAMLGAATLIAVGLHWLRARTVLRPRLTGPVLASLAAVAIVAPLIPAPYYTRDLARPAYFRSGAVNKIPRGSVVLNYPFPSPAHSLPMVWQADAKLRYRLVGGYIFIPGSFSGYGVPGAGTTKKVLDGFAKGIKPALEPAAVRRAVVQEMASWNVGTVIVVLDEPGADRAESLFTQLLGRPAERVAGVAVWYGVDALTRG